MGCWELWAKTNVTLEGLAVWATVFITIVVRFLTCYHRDEQRLGKQRIVITFGQSFWLHGDLEAAVYPVMCALHCSCITYSVYMSIC
jgi:hypothetical protein